MNLPRLGAEILYGMKRLVLPLLLVCGPLLYGEVNFTGLNLSEGNQLLFQARTDAPTFGSYDTLFEADLATRTMRPLTFFPERATLLAGNQELEIQNRFGVFRTDRDLQNMAPVAGFPSFAKGEEIQTGRINAAEASPDGRYLLYLKPTSYGSADLLLYRVADQSWATIAKGVAMSLHGPEAIWSPDSSYVVYQKNGRLYYFSVDQLLADRLFPEDQRSIGVGTIDNLRWNPDGGLYYLSGSIVYRITANEFVNRSLYSDLLPVGKVVGKIPFSFDPNFDRFWISPDGQSILLDKGGNNLFLYLLRGDDFTSTGDPVNLPYLLLPRDTRVEKAAWGADGIITVLTTTVLGKESQGGVFRLNSYRGPAPHTFVRTADTGVRGMAMSPDGARVALLQADRVIVRDYTTWQEVASLPASDPLSVLWLSNDEIIIAGAWRIEAVNLATKSSRLIALSQPGEFGYAKEGGSILARLQGAVYSLPAAAGAPKTAPAPGAAPSAPTAMPTAPVQWTAVAANAFSLAPASLASNDYRVYLDDTQVGSYRDMVMVRRIKGVGTQPLFRYPTTSYVALPTTSKPVDFADFTHGLRNRVREVSLVFNAVDTVEGLTSILHTLREYRLTCTFFLNGEFMRRHPDAVREIANSGQEVGSLFYADVNLTDSRLRLDSAFIQDGLGRNEDLYYSLTGKELSLLWHAPGYITSSAIDAAAQAVGYEYIGRDVDPLDWVTEADGLAGTGLYLPVSAIIDRVMSLTKPGSIIPIRIGKPGGDRGDYLFEKLDLLINSLLSRGYSIVPVSKLVEDSR